MNSKIKISRDRRSVTDMWREIFRRRRRMHDPLLVFNMSIFNFADEWTRTLNRLKTYEHGI